MDPDQNNPSAQDPQTAGDDSAGAGVPTPPASEPVTEPSLTPEVPPVDGTGEVPPPPPVSGMEEVPPPPPAMGNQPQANSEESSGDSNPAA